MPHSMNLNCRLSQDQVRRNTVSETPVRQVRENEQQLNAGLSCSQRQSDQRVTSVLHTEERCVLYSAHEQFSAHILCETWRSCVRNAASNATYPVTKLATGYIRFTARSRLERLRVEFSCDSTRWLTCCGVQSKCVDFSSSLPTPRYAVMLNLCKPKVLFFPITKQNRAIARQNCFNRVYSRQFLAYRQSPIVRKLQFSKSLKF